MEITSNEIATNWGTLSDRHIEREPYIYIHFI